MRPTRSPRTPRDRFWRPGPTGSAMASTRSTGPLNEPDQHNAIHGLVRWLPWQPDHSGPDQIGLSCRLAAQPGYPWTLDLTTEWTLGADGLTATHTATNLSDTPCPFG